MAHHKTNANPEECGKRPGEEHTDPKDVRDRVLQEIGCTSTTFIGPAGRPKTTGPTGCPKTIGPTGRPKTTGPIGCPKTIGPTGRPKTIGPTGRPKHRQETQPDTPNIEDTLSEFYKELEKIDSTDNTDVGNQTVADSKSCKPLETSAGKYQVSALTKSLDTDFCQNSMRRPVRPHWYQNEPYPLRDQRSSVDQMSGGPAHLSYAQNHWHPPPQNRLPFPRFHNPPFCGPPPPHFSPPFPGPPPPGMPPPPHMNDNWNCSDKANQYQQDMCWLPPHDECNRLPQDSNEDFPHHFDRNEWGHSDDSDSLYSVSHLREDFDNHRKSGADKELHEQEDPRQPSDQTLILILLRGGPGSGKECGKRPGEEHTDPKDVRDRVLQEIGCTSTTFIGPAGRPKTTGPTGCPKTIGPTGRPKTTGPIGCPKTIGPTGRPKTIGPTGRPKHRQETQPDTPNIEDTLSEFYKELEKIDSTDNTDVGNQTVADSKSCKPLETSAGKYQVSALTKSLDTDFCQNSMRRPVRPHWYQNEPYPLRDQRSSVDQMSGGPAHLSYAQNHWHPPPQNRLPFPRFHNPPFCGPPPPHFSPPFPGPPPPGMPPPPHMNDNWNCSDKANQYQQDMCWLPPHDECNRLPQDSNEDFPHHFDRNEWGHSDDSDSLYSVSHLREDFDNHRKSGADKELHEQEDPRQPSDQTLILILLRGGPGSGKSTLATELLSTGPSGVALSTDDYFFNEDGYIYDRSKLGVAHEWNQSRAKEAMLDGRSPIIIDNTNIEAWEMKPYVKMALEKGYRIDFLEPDTRWKFDPFELEKRNKHGVPQQKIAQMLDRFSFPISVDIVMNSQDPPHVSMRHRPEPQKEERFNSPNYNQQIHPNK